MLKPSDLPAYTPKNLVPFLYHLRRLVFPEAQQIAADHFYLDRTRITRYESYTTSAKPKVGYIAELARLVAEKAENAPDIQDALLQKVNLIIVNAYSGRTFQNWSALCYEANLYLEGQQAKAKIAWLTALAELDLPPDIELVGIKEKLAHLLAIVMKSNDPWLISIEGIGGLGKTTLAGEVMRQPQLQQQFKKLAWVSAKQHDPLTELKSVQIEQPTLDNGVLITALLEQLGLSSSAKISLKQKTLALKRHLKKTPCLIVIDNLETVIDYQSLVPLLQKLVNPSKVIVTSRYRLQSYTDIFQFKLESLPQTEAIALMRKTAQHQTISLLSNVPDEALVQIYDIVGGNPLVLKLVVGQITYLDLPQLLKILKQIPDKTINALYHYIYEPIWQLLEATEHQVLLMMLLAQNSNYNHLLALTQFDQVTLNSALQQLIRLSLIQVDGDLTKTRYYTIHRLTETFLLRGKMNEQTKPLNPQSPSSQFSQAISKNLDYWLHWLKTELNANTIDIASFERVRDSILRAIFWGLEFNEPSMRQAWPTVCELVFTFSPHMEKRGYWEVWQPVLQRVLNTTKKINDIKSEAKLLVLLARLLYQQNKFKKSVFHYRRAIQVGTTQAMILVEHKPVQIWATII